MIFSPYSLFTVTFLFSLFALLFVFAANISGIVRRVPLTAVYIFLAVMGIRLLIPIEISKLSIEVNSYTILKKINDFMQSEIFAVGSSCFSVGNLLVIVWITGIFVLSVFFLVKYCCFRLTIRHFDEVQDRHIIDMVDIICSELGIKSQPKVLRTISDCSPSEFGLFKQTIVLNGTQYTDEEIYYILLHEITHYRLKNDIAKCFAKILEIVFWWNPVVYLLYNQIDRLMEIYTDLSVTKNFTEIQKYSYLHCLYNVYKSINVNSISSSAFASPMIGRTRESEIEKRFKFVTKGSKTNIPICVFVIVLSLMCYMSTFFVVFQPYYDTTAKDIPSTKIDINAENSYITKEGDKYILYYNGEVLITSSDKEDLKLFFKNEEE